MHVKDFFKWIGRKKDLHYSPQKTPYVSEGQIWWASLGENIGFEINGKNDFFTRPVLILRKFSKQFYFVIPLTTKQQTGTWYVNFELKGKIMAVCLHQGRAIDYRRLRSRLAWLEEGDFEKIREGFKKLYL